MPEETAAPQPRSTRVADGAHRPARGRPTLHSWGRPRDDRRCRISPDGSGRSR